MADDTPGDGARDENLLPLDEGDTTVLSPQSAEAIGTLKEEITRLSLLGEEGLGQLRDLLDAVGEAVFSEGERAIAAHQEEKESLPAALVLFAERNLEVLARSLGDADLLAGGVYYILREAPESFVVAHAMAAALLVTTGGSEELRASGRRAYEECKRIAKEKNFGERVERLFGDERDGSGGTSGRAG